MTTTTKIGYCAIKSNPNFESEMSAIINKDKEPDLDKEGADHIDYELWKRWKANCKEIEVKKECVDGVLKIVKLSNGLLSDEIKKILSQYIEINPDKVIIITQCQACDVVDVPYCTGGCVWKQYLILKPENKNLKELAQSIGPYLSNKYVTMEHTIRVQEQTIKEQQELLEECLEFTEHSITCSPYKGLFSPEDKCNCGLYEFENKLRNFLNK